VLRDRALIGVMVIQLRARERRAGDEGAGLFVQGRCGWMRLHEKGGKEHEVPCHHNLELYLDEYIAAASIKTRIGNHTFRATGITAYLKNNGTLEAA
jgi:hypothetical protein